MYEEVDVREEGRDDKEPLVAENHVAEAVDSSP